MPCSISLNLNVFAGDNPMDGAIYNPARTSFFGVRGGYWSEWTTALTLFQGPNKFASGCFGRSCVALDSVNSKIWVGTNGDHAAGFLGDTGGAKPAKSTAGLYRFNALTLALEAFIDVTTLTFTAYSGSVHMANFGASSGIYDVLVANNRLFFTQFTGNIGIATSGYMGFLNLPGSTAGFAHNIFNSPNTQLAHTTSTSPNLIWVGQDDDNFNNDVMSWDNDDGTGTGGTIGQPTNGAHPAVCVSPVAADIIYQVDMPNQQMIKIQASTATIGSYNNLTGASVGGMTSRIRANPNDNLIYIPCPAANQMIAYNPSSDSVSHIYTVGMDSPHDFVGAPGGIKVAIQQGTAGLVLLTT